MSSYMIVDLRRGRRIDHDMRTVAPMEHVHIFQADSLELDALEAKEE